MEIFSLVGSILLKDNNISGQLDDIDKKASGTSKSMGISFSSIASAALKVAGVIGAGLGLKAMWDDSMETAQVMNQMNAVLQSTGSAAGMTQKSLLDLANSQSMLTTYSANANVATENMLLTFTNIGQKVFPDALKTVNDMSTALGQDTKNSAIQLGKALNDPITGITALSRVGVTFTDQQKNQIKAMMDAGNVAGAQSIILQELQREFGGSAEAAGNTLPGKLTILKNTFLDMGSAILDKVLPNVQSFASSILDNMPKIQQTVSDVVGAIIPKFQEWINLVLQIAKELLPNLKTSISDTGGGITTFGKAMDVVTNTLKFLADNVGLVKAGLVAYGVVLAIQTGLLITHNTQLLIHNASQLVKMAQDKIETAQIIALYVAQGIHNGVVAAATAAQWLWNAALNANPIGLVIIAITALIAGMVLLYNNSETFRNFVNLLWTDLKQFATEIAQDFTTLISNIVSLLTGLKTEISSIMTSIGDFFKQVWTDMSNAVINDIITPFINGIENLFNNMKDGLVTILNGLEDFFSGIWTAIKNIFLGAVLLILDLVSGNFTKLSSDAQSILNNLKQAIDQILRGIESIFKGYLLSIAEFLQTEWNAIKSTAETIFNDLKSYFGTLWSDIYNTANSAWSSFKTWIIGFFNETVQAAKDIWNGLIDWFKSLPAILYQIAVDMFTQMKNGVDNTIKNVYNAIVNGITEAVNWIKALPSQAIQWGTDFIQGFSTGITNAMSSLLTTVSNMANSIRGFLHFSSPDVGPLADYETWMPDFMEGLAQGIENNKFKVIDSIKSLSNDMKVTASVTSNSTNGSSESINKSQTIQPKVENHYTINANFPNATDMDEIRNALLGFDMHAYQQSYVRR